MAKLYLLLVVQLTALATAATTSTSAAATQKIPHLVPGGSDPTLRKKRKPDCSLTIPESMFSRPSIKAKGQNETFWKYPKFSTTDRDVDHITALYKNIARLPCSKSDKSTTYPVVEPITTWGNFSLYYKVVYVEGVKIQKPKSKDRNMWFPWNRRPKYKKARVNEMPVKAVVETLTDGFYECKCGGNMELVLPMPVEEGFVYILAADNLTMEQRFPDNYRLNLPLHYVYHDDYTWFIPRNGTRITEQTWISAGPGWRSDDG